MMLKLQGLDCYFLQAFAVRYGGSHDCHKQPGSMAWLSRAVAVMPRRTATVVSWMLTSIACQLRLTMVSINQLPLTWSTIMYDATLARMGHGKYVGARGEPRRDGVYVLRKRTPYAGGAVASNDTTIMTLGISVATPTRARTSKPN